MKTQKTALIALATGAAIAASAGVASAATVWASSVEAAQQGTSLTGDPARSDPAEALGAPDGDFFSLGFDDGASGEGAIILGFGGYQFGEAHVYEITFNCADVSGVCGHYPEEATLYYGDEMNWDGVSSLADYITTSGDYAGGVVVPNGDAQSGAAVTIAGAFKYVALVNLTSPESAAFENADGFDLDAVGVAPVPLPGALPLLGLGLAGLSFASRRRRGA